ncbi:MAG: HIT family protein [Sandaracinaceae bacterium]|nr:HIT family protein [Sandaracinaceae bacterium]
MTFELHPTLAADSVFVCALPLSDVRLVRDARYPWALLVPRVVDVRDPYELTEEQQLALTRESAALSRALVGLYAPFKLNVAAIGNMVPQLHVHHVARSPGDEAWPRPVWGIGEARAYEEAALAARVMELRAALGA